jgi:hypothetical protein
MQKKKEITERLQLYIELETLLNGSLEEVAENILALEKRWKTENISVDRYIRFDIQLDWSDCQDSFPEIHLYGVRMETNEEFKRRIEDDKLAAQAQKLATKKRIETTKKRELATLIRLRKKYANETTGI